MRPEKQFLLDEIKYKMEHSKGFLLARYSKMDPNLASKFRMILAKAGSDFEVVHKRILVKAAEASGYTLDPGMLEGHIGLVFADVDILDTTKIVFKFRQENEAVLEVIGGRFAGMLYSAKDMEHLSKLPSKNEMRSQFSGLLEAVPSQTLSVMDTLLTSVIYCLDNKSKT